jgi:uncharacterized protein YbcC (UPF0753/DUF2309 family)/NADH:ubiquinone oxidoreductase subunit 5 (subunit L)/multisubunit Na+/H+ antiporter MnhA subunit
MLLRIPVILAALLLTLGVAALTQAVLADPWQWRWFQADLFGTSAIIGLSFSAVSAILLTFIAGLALITAEYSRRNLRGQAHLHRFAALHSVATLSLALLVTGASLPLLALGWTASGLAIAALVGHRGTPAARRAAGYVRANLLRSDALLWLAVGVAVVALPSVDRADLGASVAAASPVAVTVLALLLVAAALIRSALFPAHRWLYETAEAPSPVSALLHAGVVNAVGLLGALVWPVFAASAAARASLIIVGLVTAVALTVAGRYRADLKGRLAASTSAQMGYLAIQVGIGLPAAGLLHVIGHGSYKAHLFLRAGGAITRSREAMAAAPGRPGIGTVLLAAGAAGAGTALGLSVWTTVPVADLLPITVVAAAALVAAVAVLRPGQLAGIVNRAAIAASLLGVAALLAGYLAVLHLWQANLAGLAGAAQIWPNAAVAAWFAVLALGLAVALVVPRLLAAGRLPQLRARIGAASLRPADAVPDDLLPQRPVVPDSEPAEMVDVAVAVALPTVAPAWPLHSVVAANPLAGMQGLHVRDAGRVAAQTWGARTLPDRAHYQRALAAGRITAADLHAAAAAAGGVPGEYAPDLVVEALLAVDDAEQAEPLLRAAVAEQLRPLTGEALAALNAAAAGTAVVRTLTERWDAGSHLAGAGLTEIADGHAATWLLDLLVADDSERTSGELWRAWQARIAAPGLDRRIGVPGFGAAARALPAEPVAALSVLLADVPATEHIGYLGRLLARNPGWPSHLAWRADAGGTDLRPDLLAIRAAYDVLLARAVAGPPVPARGSSPVRPSQAAISATAALVHRMGHDRDAVLSMAAGELYGVARLACAAAGPAGDAIWQAAYEQRYRNRMLDRIETRAAAGPEEASPPQVHVAMCIDVRSERLRRHLEAEPTVATYGFAGFFGLPIRHRPSAGAASDQLPVLLSPSAELTEQLAELPGRHGAARLLGGGALSATSAVGTPFAVAEAAAPVSVPMAAAQTLAPRTWGRIRDWAHGPATTGLRGSLAIDAALDHEQQVDAAFGFLHAIGQHRLDGALLVVAGHGSTMENNAFAAAYQCGACGGNSGAINARVMAELLNRPQVRAGLAERGVQMAPGLVAVPALHHTTTDELRIDDADVPPSAVAAVAAFRAVAAGAQQASAAERVATLPAGRVDAAGADVARRASDWAEATPEWGLAGNALFVAGPRWMTRGLNLRGRAFLHSYDPQLDAEGAVLETILTAPMVVAHWINSQYYASTVDPEHFGAGDKTTHNAVSDFAVLSGAHGDLRVGLPWQGLMDTDPAAGPATIGHEPMRLQVVVYASSEAVLQVLLAHPEVAQLVTGEWLALAVIEPVGARVLRLSPDLTWQEWDSDPLGIASADLAPARADMRRDSSGTGGRMPA